MAPALIRLSARRFLASQQLVASAAINNALPRNDISQRQSSRNISNNTAKESLGPPYHSTGLFSIPELQKPADFLKLSAEAIATCDSVRADLTSQLPQPLSSQNPYQAHEYLYQLDNISKTVCNVIDAAELCRSVHASEAWRESANQAFAMLSEYIGKLNGDTVLYETLRKIVKEVSNQSSKITPDLSEEDQRFCRLLQAEFERDGIHLPDKEREELQGLQVHVTQLETMFSQNMVQRRKEFDIDRESLEGIFRFPDFLTNNGLPEDTQSLRIDTDSDIAHTLSKYSNNPSTRRHVYMETMTACPENVAVLEALVQMRHEVSTKLGFNSYAERFLMPKMAGNQDNVNMFLQNLLQSNQPAYKKEMEELSAAKRIVESTSDGTLEPWDIPFYTGILKARRGFDANDVAVYLTLDNCIEGIKTLVDRLFGIQMIERDVSPDEAWDTVSPGEKTSLRRLEFVDEHGDLLGTMYLDLQKREGKYGHAAHFTVRCGCVQDSPYAENSTGEFQKPIIALVCNLANATNGGSSILSHSEVETIYHEMGHMLHSMLSRTKYQHLSGTRAPMDFVETPSHWLENFVWDPEFLTQVLGQHYETGSAIPDELVAKLRQSRYDFHAIERQNQILYALFDQQIFGIPDLPSSSKEKVDTTAIFANLHKQHNVPYADGSHWHSRFGHLITYGAGYYGYLYSQVFATDIWKECFEGNSMSREAGDKIWNKVLIHGGARDPNIMLKDLLGRSPRVSS